MTLLLLSLLGLLILLLFRATHHQATVRKEWEFALQTWSQDALCGFSLQADAETEALAYAYRKALQARTREESLKMLEVGLSIAERTAGNWVSILHLVGMLSRMAKAITPIEPLTPWAFRSPAVSGLALLGSIVHHVTITAGERLRLRAYILRGGWRLSMKMFRGASGRIRAEGRMTDWVKLDNARCDMAILSDETVRSFRLLLLSFAAGPSSKSLREPE